MKKLFVILMILALIPLAEAAEKLKTAILSASGDVSTNNVASRVISATLSSDPQSANWAVLSIRNGSTEVASISTSHATANWGPFPREDAPIFSTDITATITTDGTAKASFVFIEME